MAARRWQTGTLHPLFRRRVRSKTAVSELIRRKQATIFRIHGDYVVHLSVRRNVILKLRPEQAEIQGLDKFDIVFRFCRFRIEATGRKACVLAPTMPLVRQFLAEARHEHGRLRIRCVVATSDVDAWDFWDWQDAISHHDILIVTPALFRDALTAGHLNMGDFCALAIDECQHCIGSHPYAEIVEIARRRHRWLSDGVRLMGVCPCLWKAKHKRSDQRAQYAQSLQAALLATVVGS